MGTAFVFFARAMKLSNEACRMGPFVQATWAFGFSTTNR